MNLFKLDLFGKNKKLSSVSHVSAHSNSDGECIPCIVLGNGKNSYRLDMSAEEANNLIKQLRQQIELSYKTNENGSVHNWYSLDEINPELRG